MLSSPCVGGLATSEIFNSHARLEFLRGNTVGKAKLLNKFLVQTQKQTFYISPQ
ncbi:hypothetical protein H6F39_01370 [Anabaena sp. FACHB-1250]|uniref:hypothetical protein n=1 Tax=Nostocales TaxID=1161 RepID=UPI001396C28A|nr:MULTISPECIES: hypothetical protein [Nostocales]MBD2140069.1 hypothetical protein [Anabaena sp. FACHB-1250]MBD2267307.1 hypothetical protein [Anabaena sp. FACHB-1391]